MGIHTHYFNTTDENSSVSLSTAIINQIKREENVKELVLLCVGTDKVTGDSLGPIIGHSLKRANISNFHIYGTLDDPIHALNIDKSYKEIKKRHPNLPVIAVDASIGNNSHLGCVTVTPCSLKPGIGVNKQLIQVGDIALTGIVCSFVQYKKSGLMTTRLSTIMHLSDCICEGLLLVARRLNATDS